MSNVLAVRLFWWKDTYKRTLKQWIDHCFVDFHCCEASWVHFFAQLSLSAFFKFTPSRQTNFSLLFLLELLNINRYDWKLQTDTSVYKYVDKKIHFVHFLQQSATIPIMYPKLPCPSSITCISNRVDWIPETNVMEKECKTCISTIWWQSP